MVQHKKINAIYYINKLNKNHLDAEKALDKLYYPFMIKKKKPQVDLVRKNIPQQNQGNI